LALGTEPLAEGRGRRHGTAGVTSRYPGR
jgi:hypothetical protein